MNTFLFLSFLISLFVTLLARLLQQWAHQYTSFTQQPGCSPTKRARIRAIFFEGVDKYRIFWVVEALPALHRLSIYLFIVVLIAWLLDINQPTFCHIVSLVALASAAYLWFKSLPIFRPNHSPLSPTIWSRYTGLVYVVFKVLSSSIFCVGRRFDILRGGYHIRMSDGIGKTAEKIAWQRRSEIDLRILISTLEALREDGALANFFEAIPDFFSSEEVNSLRDHILFEEFRVKFLLVLNGFFDRTFSSGLLSEPDRSIQLLITCLNAAYKALGTDGVPQILFNILNGDNQWGELLQSVEMAHSLRHWSKNTDDQITHYVRRIVTRVIVGVRERDERWISLAKTEFGVPDNVLWENIRHDNSAPLSLLIYVTRQAFRTGSWTPFVLNTLTQFDMCNTIPELQQEFCALWNEIVREAWIGGADCGAVKILREIRRTYIGLHQGTDAAPTAFSAHTNFFNPVLEQPWSYRFCDIAPSSHPLAPTLVISVG